MTANIHETPMMTYISDIFRREWTNKAFCDYGTDISYTHSQAYEQIVRLQMLFDIYGLKAGDKVALCDKNCSNWAVSFLAIFTHNMVAVPLLADFHIDQIDSLVEHSEARLLITSHNVYEKTSTTDRSIMIDITTFAPFDTKADTPLARAYKQADAEFSRRYPNGLTPDDVKIDDVDLEALALISYTSGSTGNPKGVMLPYRTFWSNVVFCHDFLPPVPDDGQFMSILPMAHMYGFAVEFLYPMTTGRPIYLLTKIPSPSFLLKAFADVRPQLVVTVPLIVEKIIRGKVFPQLRTPKMRLLLAIPGVRHIVYKKIRKTLYELFGGRFYELIFGGAALSREVDEFLRKINFPYTVGYGMTECAPLISYANHNEARIGSCGKVVSRMEVKVLSDDPLNCPGELVTRGTNMMTGYYKNPEATNEAIDSEGWLHTGDLVTIDEDGFIYIRGRKKNMLLGANGQNVYPEEVEDVILGHTVADECVLVQREEKFIALTYTSDASLERLGITRDQLPHTLEASRTEVNNLLPKFAQLTTFEVRNEEFIKTPKKNIKRYLYK